MSFENFPSANISDPNPPRKNSYRGLFTGILLVALLGTWGYIIWDKSKSKEKEQQLNMQIINSDSLKSELQAELNDATMRIDALKTTNARADSLIRTKDKDIEDLKTRVQAILGNQNVTSQQLLDAKALINKLKENILAYTAEIEKLKGENMQLTEEKRVVTHERDVVKRNFDSAASVIKEKEDLIDIGSTLHASNFNIVGIRERGNGKEKQTSTAKHVDKIRITFNLDENRITPSGNKDVYVCITAPNGQPIAVEALGSGKFVTRDGVERFYTKKVQVAYRQGERQQVQVEWQQNTTFQTGNYRIEIYNNGFKIGEGVRSFKKGGLFGIG
jgi:hypothetical protein